MRISSIERDHIVATARSHFGDASRVVLFGSRVDDAARGGDIDLLIEASRPVAQPVRSEAAFLIDLWQRIGEQRIDVVLKQPGAPEQTIHKVANALGVVL